MYMNPSLSCDNLMIQEDGAVFFGLGLLWSDRQSLSVNSDAALWQKPSLWTRPTLVERRTCSCAVLELLKDNERYSKNVLLEKCCVSIFLKFRFCSPITEGSSQHNGPQSYTDNAGLGIPFNLLLEQESTATSTSSVCTSLTVLLSQTTKNTGQVSCTLLYISVHTFSTWHLFWHRQLVQYCLNKHSQRQFSALRVLVLKKFNQICPLKLSVHLLKVDYLKQNQIHYSKIFASYVLYIFLHTEK